jgi:hypothetical protein
MAPRTTRPGRPAEPRRLRQRRPAAVPPRPRSRVRMLPARHAAWHRAVGPGRRPGCGLAPPSVRCPAASRFASRSRSGGSAPAGSSRAAADRLDPAPARRALRLPPGRHVPPGAAHAARSRIRAATARLPRTARPTVRSAGPPAACPGRLATPPRLTRRRLSGSTAIARTARPRTARARRTAALDGWHHGRPSAATTSDDGYGLGYGRRAEDEVRRIRPGRRLRRPRPEPPATPLQGPRHRPSANDTNVGTFDGLRGYGGYRGWSDEPQPDERYVQGYGPPRPPLTATCRCRRPRRTSTRGWRSGPAPGTRISVDSACTFA